MNPKMVRVLNISLKFISFKQKTANIERDVKQFSTGEEFGYGP